MGIYIGFTTSAGLIIDLDDMNLPKVTRIVDKLYQTHDLEGYLIIESSPNHYHVIFNKYLEWNKITYILFNFVKNSVIGWSINQMRRGDLTLRISTNKGHKPKILTVYGETDKLIKEYHTMYELFKKW